MDQRTHLCHLLFRRSMAVPQNRPLSLSVAAVRSHGSRDEPVISGGADDNPLVFQQLMDINAGRDTLVCVGGSTTGACCMALCQRPESKCSRASRVARS